MTIATSASLAVVSSSAIMRSGLAEVLAGVPGVSVRHGADSITRLPAAEPPALVVLDLHDQHGSRLGASFWKLMPPGSRVIALCRPDDPPNLPLALRGGVRGLLTRESDSGELRTAIQAVRLGGLHVCAELAAVLLEQMTVPDPRLTNREVETLQWLARDLTNTQIGLRMGLAGGTVGMYVKRLRVKFNARNKAELKQRALDAGYIARPS